MKRFVIFLVCFGILSIYLTNTVFAQEKTANVPSLAPNNNIDYNLPFPGILPDHPLYPLKVLRDKILIVFTRDPVKKFHLYLLFADKHLAMGQTLWEKGNLALSIKTLTTGEKFLLTAAVQMLKLKQTGSLPEGVADKLKLACDKHEQIIESLILTVNNAEGKQQLNELLGINHQARQQAAPLK